MTMEDIGGRYFDVLVKKALIEKVVDCYKMHDLIHESASNFFAQECGKLMDDEESSPKNFETIRHLFVGTTNPDILRKIEKFKHLHSLILFFKYSNKDLCSALIEIFKASRSLRLLYVFALNLRMIPEEIGNLIHLRYLKIDGYNLTRLPRSLSNLYHLQYIIYDIRAVVPSQPKVDDFLPSDINNLSSLHCVKLPENYNSSICGAGKLKSLQELSMFDLRDVSGYRIGELENMNDLCKLGINCLENVKDAEEAYSANLCAKRRLTDLTLCWSNTDSRNIDLDENVLDNLQPPKCLRNLSINRYMGARSAIWMNNVNLLSNIEKIEKINLTGCMEWETLPPFGQLPFLKSLSLKNTPKVKWLESKFNGNDKYHAFPLLEKLYICGLEALEDWFEAGVATEDGCLFPCLIQLKIDNCPKLKELPSLPPKLRDRIGWTTLNFCSNSNPIPLETLAVSRCPNITSLILADETARLAALRYLVIQNCPNLISMGRYREAETTNNCHRMLRYIWISDPSVLLMEPLRSIASLKELNIADNDELVSFPNEAEQWLLKDRSSLSVLQFLRLKSLQSLPSSLESLSSLQVLNIIDVPMLRELPNLPPSLERFASLLVVAVRLRCFAGGVEIARVISSAPSWLSDFAPSTTFTSCRIESYDILIGSNNASSLAVKHKSDLNPVVNPIPNNPLMFLLIPLGFPAICSLLNIPDPSIKFTCLGLPISSYGISFDFQPLPQKISGLLDGWEAHLLSFARRFPIYNTIAYWLRGVIIPKAGIKFINKQWKGTVSIIPIKFTFEPFYFRHVMKKLISAGLRYLKDQVTWQKRTKEELEKLKEILPQIQAVVYFASSQEQITQEYPALNKWLCQLRDAIDDADDVLDELESMELEKQLTKNKKLRRVSSIMKSMKKRLVKIGKRALKIDPNLKRLEEAVQKLFGVSTNVASFLFLVKDAKKELQKQQLELHGARETGCLPKNDLIGRGKDKELVMEWLRNPSNEHRGTDLYRNISLLSIVGHGGMGKTTLLQHVYNDEITKEFDFKMWVCVSNNFDVKKVIADMLESLKMERSRCDTLDTLQNSLRTEIMSQKFLLVLDDIWEEDEEKDKSKWEDVLAPLASGGFGSKILVTTRTDSVALMFANVIKKKKKINSIHSILRLSYIVLSNPLKSCFAFCGMFAQDHEFDKDDLIRMWIALGFIQPSLDREETMEDIGGRYFDVLVKKSFFEKFHKYELYFQRNSPYYKMHDLLHELAQSVSIQEYLRVENSIKLSSIIPETLRHLSIQT
ncbi:hypothetical protein IEQ34_007829 [Dendrobium chrysotoxum]|uniref:Uncharacterized protein n=1 Tax=Dendrobium chrysotoxum TaxID=161865 RepID=A0AAV7H5V0_DENCH|nr:hypothetical protein IEQ34_007829 [Dendrobium chrysotoxum]